MYHRHGITAIRSIAWALASFGFPSATLRAGCPGQALGHPTPSRLAAWSALYSTVSRPFDPPETGKIAVKVINHYGDEVLQVYEV